MYAIRYSARIDGQWISGTVPEIAKQCFYTESGMHSVVKRLRGTADLKVLLPYIKCDMVQTQEFGVIRKEHYFLSRNCSRFDYSAPRAHVESIFVPISECCYKGLSPVLEVKHRGIDLFSRHSYREIAEKGFGRSTVRVLYGKRDKNVEKVRYTGVISGECDCYRIGKRWFTDWGAMMHDPGLSISDVRKKLEKRTGNVLVDSDGVVLDWR